MPQEYWVKITSDGEEYGPYTGAQVREYAAAGNIKPESLISLDHATWHAARRIKGLFPAAAPVAAPAQHAAPAHAQHAAPVQRAPVAHAPAAAPVHTHAAAAHAPNTHAAAAHSAPAHAAPAHAAHSHAARPAALAHPAPERVMEVPESVAAYDSAPEPTEQAAPVKAHESVATPAAADQRFRGMMLFLYIMALLLGASISYGSVNLLRTTIKLHADQLAIILAGAFVAVSVLTCLTGLLGIFKLRVDGVLFLCGLMLALGEIWFSAVTISVNEDRIGASLREHWQHYVITAAFVAFVLAFPLLCMAGAVALRRARKSIEPHPSTSPWRSLAKTLALVAFVGGALYATSFGKDVFDLREFATGKPVAHFTGVAFSSARAELLRSACLCAASALMFLGGFIALVSRSMFGRILIILGAAVHVGYGAYSAINDNTLVWDIEQIVKISMQLGPVVLFLILAGIVLTRSSLSKPKAET